MLMRRAGLKGLPTHKYRRPLRETPTAGDLVDRDFTPSAQDLLRVTDITEHPTREVKAYRKRWKTRLELANAIVDYLEIFHNRQRRHSSLGMLTPNEYERLHTTLSAA
jgi:hypothetical protein